MKNLRNVVLTGMPGCGKSTIGVVLAKKLSMGFVDTDILLQCRSGVPLQQIVDTKGYMALREVEEKELLALRCAGSVVATGGSAAYSQAAMAHLRRDGVVVFLDVDLATLQTRVSDFSKRGLAKRPDQTFEDLFNERHLLYVKYADITIDSSRMTHEQTCEQIVRSLQNFHDTVAVDRTAGAPLRSPNPEAEAL